jgi:hypothetical protein
MNIFAAVSLSLAGSVLAMLPEVSITNDTASFSRIRLSAASTGMGSPLEIIKEIKKITINVFILSKFSPPTLT